MKKKLKAFSLLELLLSISLFSLFLVVVGSIVIDSFRAIKNNQYKDQAVYMLKEVGGALTILKNDLWSLIIVNTDAGPKHLEFADNKYSIVDGALAQNDINIAFTVSNVQRDGDGNLVASGGTVDVHTRKIIVTASWTDIMGEVNEVISEYYVNDWNTTEWVVSSQAEFDQGSFFQTYSVNDRGGEVTLESLFYPDWCKPTLQLHTFDIPGNAYARSIFGSPGKAYLGTNGNASGTAFTDIAITGVDDPLVSVRGVWNSYTTNDIFVSGDYAYLATKHPNNEVVILNISTLPITQVGQFNPSSSNEASSVWVEGDVGFVAIGRDVYTFDLTLKTGNRPQLDSLRVALNTNWGKTSQVSKIVVKDNYLYAALNEDWYELTIVDVTNPSDMSIASQTTVNNQQTGDIQVSTDGNRVFFSTSSSDTEAEFFIIDTAEKTGPRTIVSEYDTNGMNINGVAIVEVDNRAILVGEGGIEYQVISLNNEEIPEGCGSMELDVGIYDISAVIDEQGNSFSYIVTNDPVKDFQIIRGGAGGGGGQSGYGYVPTGTFTSSVLDTTSSNTYFYYLSFDTLIPANTDIMLQVRTGNSPDLSAEPWVGPDGQTNTFYTRTGDITFAESMQYKRYIQFKAYLSSDTVYTPELELVRLNYQE